MRITFAGPNTVTFDENTRTLTGLAVPYGPAGNGWTFTQGSLSWGDVSRVKLAVNHDYSKIIGVATDLTDTPAGLMASFRLPNTAAADAAIADVKAGLLDGLSVGVEITDYTPGDYRTGEPDAVVAAQLREVSLTGVPAFDDARVTALAAQYGTTTTNQEDRRMAPTDQAAPAAETVETAPDASAAAVSTFAAPAATTAAPAAPAPVAFHAPARTGREESPYIFGVKGSYLRDLFAVKNGTATEQQRQDMARFDAMTADLKRGMAQFAAGDPLLKSGTAGQLWQNGYRPDLLVGELDLGRPICSVFQRVAIENNNPFMIPTFSQTDGVVAAHSAGTAGTDAAVITVGSVTVTPAAYSGFIDVGRELIDAGSPNVDSMLLDSIGLHYRNIVEGVAKTALETAGNATADASAPTTGALLLTTLLQHQSTIVTSYGSGADAHLVATDAYNAGVKAVDTTGRQLFPYIGPTNAAGQTGNAGSTLAVNGVPVIPSPLMTAKKIHTVKRDAFLVAESPMLTFTFDQPNGPGTVRLAAYGYFAFASTRKLGNIQSTSGVWT